MYLQVSSVSLQWSAIKQSISYLIYFHKLLLLTKKAQKGATSMQVSHCFCSDIDDEAHENDCTDQVFGK